MSDTPSPISPEREATIQSLFADAVELPTGEQSAFLDRACRDDAALREELDVLLAAHRGAATFLNAPAATLDEPERDELIGTRVGRYTITATLGEGGFGTVYRARQDAPIRRDVALKIIKLGMDTRQVIARFDAERQALAILDHAGIAKVFDAGTTASGRPYFVMELVEGASITAHCDRENLSARQRLELFVPVCRALQHAHQKGIIHRDIKPNNVLVAVRDGVAVPKIIDFGIAKATRSKLTERTLFTEDKQLVGTPAYMSPEQAGAERGEVDTRSDVYSMGVLLYELLTGTTPIEERSLRSAAYDQMQRMIRDIEPPPPSARVTTLGDRAASIAAVRDAEPRALTRAIRGEIDWIVMKCLEKDPARRYESAGALSEDLSRHLAGEIVLASPPDGLYRIRKFTGRHRLAIGITSLFLVAMMAALIISLVSLVRVSRARRQAEAANVTATQVTNYALQIFSDDKGETALREAYDRVRETYGPDHPLAVVAERNLGDRLASRHDYSAAEPLLRDSLSRARRIFNPTSNELISNVAELILCLHSQGEFVKALPLAYELHRTISDPSTEVEQRLAFCNWLGSDLTLLHMYDEARIPLLEADKWLQDSGVISMSHRGVFISLAEGCEAGGQTSQAADWRAKAAAYSTQIASPHPHRPLVAQPATAPKPPPATR